MFGSQLNYGILRSVVRETSIYFGFTVFNKVIPFLLIPLLTRYIDPTGYGIIALFGSVTAIATPLLGVCANSVLFQRYHQMLLEERHLLVNDCYKVVVVVSCVVILIAPFFSVSLKQYLEIDLFWFELALVTASALMILTLSTSLFQIKMQPFQFGMLQSAYSLLNVIMTVVLVIILELSWQGRLWSLCLTAVLVSLVSVYLNYKNGDLRFDHFLESTQVMTVVRLGGALIPSNIAGGVIAMSDRFLLGGMTTLDVVGVYAVGFSFAQLTDIILNSLSQAYLPYLYKHGRSVEPKARIRIVHAVYAVTLVSILAALSVTLLAPIAIDLLINARYQGAKLVVGWLSLSFALICIGSPFQGLIMVVERNFLMTYISLVTLLVSLLGGYVFINRFGMEGAAMAVALASGTSMLLNILFSLKYNPCPWLDASVIKEIGHWSEGCQSGRCRKD